MSKAKNKLRLTIPEQGIDQTFSSKEEMAAFFDRETAFYNREQSMGTSNFRIANIGLGDANIRQSAVPALSNLSKRIGAGDFELLEGYIEKARSFRILVGQGILGQRLEALSKEGATSEAKWLAYFASAEWFRGHELATEFVAGLRAAWSANPASYAHANVLSIAQSQKDSAQALKTSTDAAEVLQVFMQEKMALFDGLEDLYRQKLILDEPAVLWSNIAVSKVKSWRTWLSIFAMLVIAPIIAALSYSDVIIPALVRLTNTASGGISLSGLAAITVPALFYAWLLKNVSRVFIQNLNLADDAAHRRALALTYLGLAANPKLEVTQNDRALILNALFRPIPPQTTDEGPPSGLIDLLQKKAG